MCVVLQGDAFAAALQQQVGQVLAQPDGDGDTEVPANMNDDIRAVEHNVNDADNEAAADAIPVAEPAVNNAAIDIGASGEMAVQHQLEGAAALPAGNQSAAEESQAEPDHVGSAADTKCVCAVNKDRIPMQSDDQIRCTVFGFHQHDRCEELCHSVTECRHPAQHDAVCSERCQYFKAILRPIFVCDQCRVAPRKPYTKLRRITHFVPRSTESMHQTALEKKRGGARTV